MEKLIESFFHEGFVICEDVFDVEIVMELKNSLYDAIEKERELKVKIGSDPEKHDELQVVCCPFYDDIFLDVMCNEYLMSLVNGILGENCILFSYNNSSIPSGSGNFSSRPHVDRAYFTGDYLEGIGVLLMLDDFSANNGATWFLPGSHLDSSISEPDDFYLRAGRLIAKAGSVFIFNPRLWHAGGINSTDSQRDALILAFSRPHIKQHLDMVELLSGNISKDTSMAVLQKLGFFARPPATLEQYYTADIMSSNLWRNKQDDN